MNLMKPTRLSAQAQKAVYLLRSHFVFVTHLVRNSYVGATRRGVQVPEFSWQDGIFDTQTGRRVSGFSSVTLKELRRAKLLGKPAKVLTGQGAESVYFLSDKALQTFVIGVIVNAVIRVGEGVRYDMEDDCDLAASDHFICPRSDAHSATA
jgi:hypothetical protein